MKGLIGAIFMAIGILIAGASGLCSLVVIASSAGNPQEWAGPGFGGFFGGVMIVLMFGGIPFLIGLGIFFLGRRLMRSERAAAGLPDQQDAVPPPASPAADAADNTNTNRQGDSS